jgi:hypothetical protein
MAEQRALPDDFKELIRYQRLDEVRVYYVRVASPGLELWRVTDTADDETRSIKEADLTSIDETLQLLEDIKRSLTAAGWTEA